MLSHQDEAGTDEFLHRCGLQILEYLQPGFRVILVTPCCDMSVCLGV